MLSTRVSRMVLSTHLRSAAPVASMSTVTDKVKETAGKVAQKVGEVFQDTGAVGKKFDDPQKGGPAGAAQQAANTTDTGDLDRDGKVGKQFTSDGKIGGKVEEAAEKVADKGKEMKKDARTGS